MLTCDDGRRLDIGQALKPPTSDEQRLSHLGAQLLGQPALQAPAVGLAVSV